MADVGRYLVSIGWNGAAAMGVMAPASHPIRGPMAAGIRVLPLPAGAVEHLAA